ncbi:MAG: hypothetical protein ACNS62_05765 [Candidatus Cyclobacteriaceae bacterium M3_2C_046]
MTVKHLLLIILIGFTSKPALTQDAEINPVELSLKKRNFGRSFASTRFTLLFSKIGGEYLAVKNIRYQVLDDQGNDLSRLGRDILVELNKKGFFTEEQVGWQFSDYKFYKVSDAFSGTFFTFGLPHEHSQSIQVKGTADVMIKWGGKAEKFELAEVHLKSGELEPIMDFSMTIREKNMLTLGENQYRGYEIVTDLPIASVEAEGARQLEGYTDPQEFYLDLNQETTNLIITVPAHKINTIDFDLEVSLGL